MVSNVFFNTKTKQPPLFLLRMETTLLPVTCPTGSLTKTPSLYKWCFSGLHTLCSSVSPFFQTTGDLENSHFHNLSCPHKGGTKRKTDQHRNTYADQWPMEMSSYIQIQTQLWQFLEWAWGALLWFSISPQNVTSREKSIKKLVQSQFKIRALWLSKGEEL